MGQASQKSLKIEISKILWQSVHKNEKFSLTKKIFRQINSLVTYVISKNFAKKHEREFP